MNPYQELNISKEATGDEIKKAFYDKAKKLHPDKGGDPDEFKKINHAYAILKDARQREYYDKYGQEEKPDAKLSQAINIAFQIINGAIERDEADMGYYFSVLKQQWTNDHTNNIRNQKASKEKLLKFKKRIKKHPENDFIGQFINEQIKVIELNIQNIETDWNSRCLAFKLLEEYKFSEIQAMQQVTFTLNTVNF
jgi:curved DNA-binding protein CbpA